MSKQLRLSELSSCVAAHREVKRSREGNWTALTSKTSDPQLSTGAEGNWARTTCLDSETVEKKGQPVFQNMLTTNELARVLLWPDLTTEASQGQAIFG